MAFIVVDHLPVRTERDLRFVAPERTIVAVLDSAVPLRGNEHALPAEMSATIVVNSSESGAFHT